MRRDERIDVLMAAARAAPTTASSGHRGGRPLELDDAQLLDVIDGMAGAGTLERDGRRVRVAGHRPALGDEMQQRVDRLLSGLREAGFEPPRVEGIAARLGIPSAVLAQLRDGGDLVAMGQGIDYASETWAELRERLDALAAGGPMTPARVRSSLRLSRRYADVALAGWRAERLRVRSRRPGG